MLSTDHRVELTPMEQSLVLEALMLNVVHHMRKESALTTVPSSPHAAEFAAKRELHRERAKAVQQLHEKLTRCPGFSF